MAPLFKPIPDEPAVADNACGALARIIIADCSALPLNQLLPVFLVNLPLKEDFVENKTVYSALIFLIQQQNPHIAPLIPQVLDVFTKALLDPNVKADIQSNIATTLKALLSAYGQQLQSVVNALPHQQIQAVQRLFG